MAKEIVDALTISRASGIHLYNQIVDAWEAVVDENTRQINLVTPAQAKQWLDFKNSFTSKLINVADKASRTGRWDNDALNGFVSTLTGATHKTERELIGERAPEAGATQPEVLSLVNRLRKILR